MSAEFNPDEIKQKIEQQREATAAAEAEALARRYELIRPFGSAADAYVRQVQNQDRFFLGLSGIDVKTRGHARGELTFVTGRAGSGKTQVVLNALHNNSDKHCIIFTPDETPEAVLAKLVAVRYGISADVLEERVKANDPEALDIIRSAASEDFRNLIVIDAGLTIDQMGQALDEAEDFWGDPCDIAVYDYVELLPGDTSYNGIIAKAQAIKAWCRTANVPMFGIRQNKRGDGDQRGKAQGMDGMAYGGEAEATIILEVYRKREDRTMSQWDREHTHKNTVTVNVAKNKRPPMKTGEVDLYMNPDTGHIRTATREDMVRDGAPTRDASELARAMKENK